MDNNIEDKKLTLEEFKTYKMRKDKTKSLTDAKVEGLFKDIDTGGNTYIEAIEYFAYYEKELKKKSNWWCPPKPAPPKAGKKPTEVWACP